MLWIIYNLLFPIVFLCMLPKFMSRMLKRGGYGQHFEQRIGHFGSGTKERLRERPRIWVHAVSVGEIYVALKFMKAYRAVHPDAFFALSTTTSTAHAIGRERIDARDVLFYFPVDLPVIIKKVLRIINPVRIVLVEGEFWPNLIRLADKRGVPISLINGTMSERSFRGYGKLKSLTSDMLRRINPICARGMRDAERFLALGAPKERVHIMGSVKFDVAERDPIGERAAADVMKKICVRADAVVLLGGSTWPGEENALCALYKKLRAEHSQLFMVVVPRHVERKDEVMSAFVKHGLSFVRRSEIDAFDGATTPDLLFVDTTGELSDFYSVADIIFVGKSLLEHGGQNPIEPAMHGKAVVVGPNMENFPAVVPEFLDRDAVRQVANTEALAVEIEKLLVNSAERAALGERAAKVVADNQGVMDQTVMILGGY